MLDVLVTGGTVVDGTGAPGRRADIGIRDGRVVAIGDVDEPAARTIDATGQVVTPGFIDIHTHYDAQLFWDPAATPSPFHGVTTVIGGNCGFTIAPVEPDQADYLMRMLARVEGMPLESLTSGVPWGQWRSFGELLDKLDAIGPAVNAGFLVGHSAIRRCVMGDETDRAAKAEEVDAMTRLLGAALTEGGLGFSSSKAPTHNDADGHPVPSRAAEVEEILALCRVVAEHEGTTVEMIPAIAPFNADAIDLMAQMSIAAQRPVNWNVLGIASARPEAHLHQLAASDYAAERGGRVVALTVPGPMRFHLTFKTGFILDALPDWAPVMALAPAEKLAALRDPAVRERLRAGAMSDEAGGLRTMANWPQVLIVETFAPENTGLAGRTFGDVARERGGDVFDVVCDVVIADELRTVMLPRTYADDDETWKMRAELWQDPRVVLGASDAGAHLDMIDTFNYTTTMLQACRDRGLLPIEHAVRLLTDAPARLYGINGRGRIADGWFADLVVLDPERVGPGPLTTRFDLPGGAGRLYGEAEGITHVLVNGTPIVTEGKLTGDRPGTVLRSGRDTTTVRPA
ncbi:MAG: Aminoacylase [Acidimicrobiales bacterium]|jgi:N-acyl-D-aspartate/D-glutamate deacylase|nr:Aminoacylase [Acidimicrobiales bacterium]